MRIKKIKKTCLACPTQWEGMTMTNKPIYIRYRWGYLSVRVGKQGKGISSAVKGDEILGKPIGDDLDGYLPDEELRKHTKGIIDWHGVKKGRPLY